MKNKGFTLLEVMVTVTVLAIGLIGLVKAFSSSIQANSFTQDLTQALFLAEEKMAEIESTPQTSLGTKSGDFAPEYPLYRWQVIIRSTENPDIQEAILTVSWEKRGVKRETKLVTLLEQKAIGEK